MKLSEMREKTVEELKQFVKESKQQLLNFRIQKTMHKLENTAEISKTKRLIAQAKTVITEKEAACEQRAQSLNGVQGRDPFNASKQGDKKCLRKKNKVQL